MSGVSFPLAGIERSSCGITCWIAPRKSTEEIAFAVASETFEVKQPCCSLLMMLPPGMFGATSEVAFEPVVWTSYASEPAL